MTQTRLPPTPARVDDLRDVLTGNGLLATTSVDGLYLRSLAFESIVRAVEGLVHRTGALPPAAVSEPLLFLPPIMPRDWFDRTDYVRSFPDLLGSVHVFRGADAEHAELLKIAEHADSAAWARTLDPAEVVLSSAACHSAYAALRGILPPGGRRLEVQGICFRHEPSTDPWRMQSFRMHEFVRVGTPDEALAHRAEWLERAELLLAGLGLPVGREVANDPFFGRAGRMLARSQRGAELKYELVCPVTADGRTIAIASANYHLDHFGQPFGIRTADGADAHSSCIGFGLDRIAIALVATHGPDAATWPAAVREQLLT